MTAGWVEATAEILLVEDNPGDVRLVREALREIAGGRRLHAVASVDAAIAFLQRRDGFECAPRPSLILLDLNLPRRPGFDLLCELQGHPTFGSIPIVVLTSSTSEDDRRRAVAKSARTYLTKPRYLDDYVTLLREATEIASGPGADKGCLRP